MGGRGDRAWAHTRKSDRKKRGECGSAGGTRPRVAARRAPSAGSIFVMQKNIGVSASLES